MQKYIDQHSLESAYIMADEAQLFPEARLKTVKGILERMKNPLVRMVASGVVRRASSKMSPASFSTKGIRSVKTVLICFYRVAHSGSSFSLIVFGQSVKTQFSKFFYQSKIEGCSVFISVTGISSQVRPSSNLPPIFEVRPPHCL
jgi:hypothetical protein